MGKPIRNWLHAEDTALGVIKIIESGKQNEIYNIAGGFEQSNIDTVKKIMKAYFGNVPKNFEDYIDFSVCRAGQDVRYSLNDQKLRNLGWSPTKNFDKEIKSIVNFYKKNFVW